MKTKDILLSLKSYLLNLKRLIFKYPLLTFALIGLLVYGVSLFNGFVWDDEEQLLNNTLVHSLTNIPQLLSNSTFSTGGATKLGGVYYRPVMMIYFAVLHSFFGPSGFVFHLAQVTIHILGVWLLYKIVAKLTNKRVGFFSAILFLVHPVNVEAVVYVSAVQDVLVAFFGLLSLWVLVSRRNVVWAVLFLFIALLAKENAVVFLLIELTYLVLFGKGLTRSAGCEPRLAWLTLTAVGTTNKEQQDSPIGKYIVYVVLAVSAYVLLRFGVANVQFQKFEFAPIVQLSFFQRLLHIPALFTYYLSLAVWPANLAIAQHWVINNFTFINFVFPLLLSVSFFLFLFLGSLKIGKAFTFFAVWFIVGIGMYMQLFPFDFTVAERWFYIGLMGLIGLTVLTGEYLNLLKKPIYILLYCGIIILLGMHTVGRSLDWKDELTLFAHDIQISRDSFDLTNNYGVALFRVGQYDEAAYYFQRSIQLAPSWIINTSNLGAVYQRKKNYAAAKKYYLLSMKYGDYYLAYENYTGILIAEKKYDQAQKFIAEQALTRFPYNQTLQKMEQYLVSINKK